MGVEKEKIEKSYKLKVWRLFQIQNFSTYKEGRLTSNLALKNVGVQGLVIFLQKKIVTVKKFNKVFF